jgi:release factor glutamine methyltransferase
MERLDESMRRLERGEPLPYVLGHWEFFGMAFDITPDVLIPRPETELLVEKAIAWLQALPGHRRVVDVGTGSGIVAVSIAVHIPDAIILATDISTDALKVAQANSAKFGVQDRIQFVHCDLLPGQGEFFPGERFDLMCANLPYIPTKTLQGLPVHGREPYLALDGGTDGLDLIRRLMKFAPARIAPDGHLLLEIESTQGAQVMEQARAIFYEAEIQLHRDLAGNDRLLEVARHR